MWSELTPEAQEPGSVLYAFDAFISDISTVSPPGSHFPSSLLLCTKITSKRPSLPSWRQRFFWSDQFIKHRASNYKRVSSVYLRSRCIVRSISGLMGVFWPDGGAIQIYTLYFFACNFENVSLRNQKYYSWIICYFFIIPTCCCCCSSSITSPNVAQNMSGPSGEKNVSFGCLMFHSASVGSQSYLKCGKGLYLCPRNNVIYSPCFVLLRPHLMEMCIIWWQVLCYQRKNLIISLFIPLIVSNVRGTDVQSSGMLCWRVMGRTSQHSHTEQALRYKKKESGLNDKSAILIFRSTFFFLRRCQLSSITHEHADKSREFCEFRGCSRMNCSSPDSYAPMLFLPITVAFNTKIKHNSTIPSPPPPPSPKKIQE